MKTTQALLALTVLLAFTTLFDADGQTNITPSASLKIPGTNELTTNVVATLLDLTTINGKTY